MLFDSLDEEGDPALHLERMKCEFLIAQQRHRARGSQDDVSPDLRDDTPPVVPPVRTDGPPAPPQALLGSAGTACAFRDSTSRPPSLP